MKVGIVCDDYKVEMFVKLLSEAGIVHMVNGEFSSGIVSITCMTTKTDKVKEIVEQVTDHFDKASKN